MIKFLVVVLLGSLLAIPAAAQTPQQPPANPLSPRLRSHARNNPNRNGNAARFSGHGIQEPSTF